MQHCREQFSTFSANLTTRTQALETSDSLRELAVAFEKVSNGQADLYDKAPALIARLFETYPDFAPTFPRELLWFLGGECLHFMPDEEISAFQHLDELRIEAQYSGKVLDFQAAHAKLMKSQ